MNYQIRKINNDGSLQISFRYWENGKNKTVPNKSLPKFKSEAEVINYLPLIEAKHDSLKMRRERREAWFDKFTNFVTLKDEYKVYAKRKAKYTWQSKIGYIQNYIFKFYLEHKREVNLNLWFKHFAEFREWIQTAGTFKNEDKMLAPNTINHIINELNMFLVYVAGRDLCSMQPRCETFAGAKEDSKLGLEFVHEDQEAEDVYNFLSLINPIYSDAFWLMINTGMRISEIRGIGPDNIRFGDIPQESLNKLILDSGLPKYNCFIFFNIQVANKVTYRNEQDEVEFKPLKTKRNDSPENTRYVPIFDMRSYNIIKKHMAIAKEKYMHNEYGSKLIQYPFFYDILNQTILNKHFDKFYEENSHYQRKTCHKTRHTFSTWLGGRDITGTIQEYICGHQRSSAKRYNKLKSQLNEKCKLKTENVFAGW